MTPARSAGPFERNDAATAPQNTAAMKAAASFVFSGTVLGSMFVAFCFIGTTEGVAT